MFSDEGQRHVTAQKAAFGGAGLLCLGAVVTLTTAGQAGGPTLVTRLGIVSLGFAVIGGTLVTFDSEIAAIEARYDYGETGTRFIDVLFLVAAVVFFLGFALAPA